METILIFFGVIIVTALIFGIWAVLSILRLILRGFLALVRGPRLPPMQVSMRGRVCVNERCRAVNPGGAGFCRRCGRELGQVQRVRVGRAAIL